MKQCLKLEFFRYLHQPFTYIALGIGILIVLLHVGMDVYPRSLYLTPLVNLDYPYSIYNCTLPLDYQSKFMFIYYYAMPLLIAIPYAGSYLSDRNSGYIYQIYGRIKRIDWLKAKYIVVFCSGAVMYAIPVLLDLFLTAIYIPAVIPQRTTAWFAVFEGSMGNVLFYEHPMCYYIFYLLISMLFCGSMACLSLAVVEYIEHVFFIQLIPLIFVMVVNAFSDITEFWTLPILQNMSPIGLVGIVNAYVCLTELILLMGLGNIMFKRGGKNVDII